MKMDINEIKEKMNTAAGPITFGRMQTIATFLKRAGKSELSVDDIISYVEHEQSRRSAAVSDIRKEKERRLRIMNEKAPKCPNCRHGMRLFPVRDQNPNGYQSRWACVTGWMADDPEKICGYEQLNTESIQEIYKNFGIVAKGDKRPASSV